MTDRLIPRHVKLLWPILILLILGLTVFPQQPLAMADIVGNTALGQSCTLINAGSGTADTTLSQTLDPSLQDDKPAQDLVNAKADGGGPKYALQCKVHPT